MKKAKAMKQLGIVDLLRKIVADETQRMRDLDAEDRRLMRELDPFGWEHWN
jgi:hypothetical protein